ncbi:MAG: hypothetical protein ACHQET_02675 [Chitinophagales bacterium]
MRYLLFISWICYCCSCAFPYPYLHKVQADPSCIEKFKPQFASTWYNIDVQIQSRHLSGLLVIKQMPDSSTRIVCTTQTGISLFDFGFLSKNEFKVYHIIDQMNRKFLIRVLQEDFDLILFRHKPGLKLYVYGDSTNHYFAFPANSGIDFYITDPTCAILNRIERSYNSNIIVVAHMTGSPGEIPELISIAHRDFRMNIELKKMEHVDR